ncbi:MAG: hypothetical protein KAW41_02165 [Candidatus Diapherotrites archaeon]|nr:hypothetical protein [Candidatus Diapherotrites archaeon]
MILFLLVLEFCLAMAVVILFLYISSLEGKEFLDWLIIVMVFFAIIKLASVFMVIHGMGGSGDVIATLDLGFATAFTAFVFLRSREVGLV